MQNEKSDNMGNSYLYEALSWEVRRSKRRDIGGMLGTGVEGDENDENEMIQCHYVS